MLNYTQGSLFYPIKYNAIMFGIAGFPHSMRQPKAAAKNMGTLWLFNIAMENGPFIDGLPGFTY